MNNPFTIYDKHPHADAYRVGAGYTMYAIIGVEKRFTDAELAAEVHAFTLMDHKYPEDPDQYGDEDWEEYDRVWIEAEKTLYRFATLPHYDE